MKHLKDMEAQHWNAAAAGWARWWETIERATRPVSDRLIALAKVAGGDRILDLATGAGEPAISAAHRVGPSGHVVAVDISAEMIAHATQRAADLGLSNISFRTAAMESLELATDPFDAALCRWGLMFVSNLTETLGNLRTLIRPGGRFAAAAWSGPAEVPFMNVEREALAPYLPDDDRAYGIDLLTPFRFARPGDLEQVLVEAGFRNVACERVEVTYEFASPAAYAEFRRDLSSRATALAQRLPVETVDRAWRGVADAAGAFAGPDGRVRMTNVALCVVGDR